ncbi:hypothetical protein TNCV_222121 [Trichonephila clavipes]|nr:hypothetical protein TNCV_222121 [Trichonephila clavipes]
MLSVDDCFIEARRSATYQTTATHTISASGSHFHNMNVHKIRQLNYPLTKMNGNKSNAGDNQCFPPSPVDYRRGRYALRTLDVLETFAAADAVLTGIWLVTRISLWKIEQ